MFKRMAVTLALLVALPSLALAHSGSHKKMMGTVSKIEASKLHITTTDGRDSDILFTATTTFVKNGKKASVRDVVVGSRVVVELTSKGMAEKVMIGKTGKAPKHTQPALSAAPVAEALRAAGLKVKDAGLVEQPFFGVPAHVFTVDGNDVQVYEFADSAAAGKAASQVAPNGGSVGTTMLSWMAPPHFFRKDRLIVNYIGTSEATLRALRNLLGPQFAGR